MEFLYSQYAFRSYLSFISSNLPRCIEEIESYHILTVNQFISKNRSDFIETSLLFWSKSDTKRTFRNIPTFKFSHFFLQNMIRLYFPQKEMLTYLLFETYFVKQGQMRSSKISQNTNEYILRISVLAFKMAGPNQKNNGT